MTSFTPNSVAEFIGSFKNMPFTTGSGASPFYYEDSTHTINFGYRINITDAANANSTSKSIIDQALRANGIDLSADQYAQIAGAKTGNHQAGVALAQSLNSVISQGGTVDFENQQKDKSVA